MRDAKANPDGGSTSLHGGKIPLRRAAVPRYRRAPLSPWKNNEK